MWSHGCCGRRVCLLCVPLGGCFPAFACCPDRSPAAAGPARPLAVRAASLWLGASPRCPARPCRRPWVPQSGPVGQVGRSETTIAFAGAGRASNETAIAFAGAGRASTETVIAFAGAGRASTETGVAFAGAGRASTETVVAFAGAGRASTETAIAFAGAKWVFLVHFSGAEVMPVSAVPCWGRAVVLLVSTSPRCRASCA